MTCPVCIHNAPHTFLGCTFTWHECSGTPCSDPGALLRCGCYGDCVHGMHAPRPVIVAVTA